MKQSFSTSTTSTDARSSIPLALIALGVTSTGAQIILLREGLALAYGNELVVGVLLGSWLTLTGFGAFLGRWIGPRLHSPSAVLLNLILCGFLPIPTVVMATFLRVWMFPPGAMLDLASILLGGLLLLFPFCLVSGTAFVIFTISSTRKVDPASRPTAVGRAYGWEAAGSFVGGACVSALMLLFVSTLDALLLLFLGTLTISFVIALQLHSIRGAIVAALLVVSAGGAKAFIDFDWLLRERLYAGQELLEYHNTPYGALAITRQGDQRNVFENNVFVGSSDDVISREEAVHYAMAQRPLASSVLMVSGGSTGALQELVKYPRAEIDYVEIDPAMVKIVQRQAGGFPTQRVHIVVEDAIRFLRQTHTRYDVALLLLPDPSTLQINRYFTVEFLRSLKEKLLPDGVVSWSIASSADYLGQEARQVRSVQLATGRNVFENVIVLPGERDFFLASDGHVDLHVVQKIEAARIPTLYVNRSYLDEERIKARSADILRTINENAPLNSDFSPISTWWQLRFWLRYFESPGVIPLVLVLACLLAMTLRPNVLSLGAFAIGMGGMTLEMELLLGFQILSGNLYEMTGVLLTVFMGGLAVGARIALRQTARQTYALFGMTLVAIAAVAFVMPSVLCWIRSSSLSGGSVFLFFLGAMLLVSVLAGTAFARASALKIGERAVAASELYGSDLAGSAVAAFLLSTLLIPSLGFQGASWAVSAVLLFAGGSAAFKQRTRSRNTVTT